MSKLNEPRTESYLVRLWRDSTHSPWRASLQKIRANKMAYFACPEDLWAYLQAEMTDECHQSETTDLHQLR